MSLILLLKKHCRNAQSLFLLPKIQCAVLKKSSFLREEGMIPYIPELPRPFEATVNYNQSIFRVKAIKTVPAGLESTSLVFVYGLGKFII